MTSIEASAPGGAAPLDSTGSRDKAVLFCPNCGHESAVDGDWQQVLGEETVLLRCPECGTDL